MERDHPRGKRQMLGCKRRLRAAWKRYIYSAESMHLRQLNCSHCHHRCRGFEQNPSESVCRACEGMSIRCQSKSISLVTDLEG